MNALLTGRGWIHHPATKMWRGYEWALLQYQRATVSEWLSRGYSDTCLEKTIDVYFKHRAIDLNTFVFPDWLGDYDLHESHRSNLVRKDPMYYLPIFGDVPDDLEYVWPTPNLKNRGYRMANRKDLLIENAHIMFRNFGGRVQQFNSEGDRNFCVFLEPEQAANLKEEGWNIKYLRPKDDGDEPQAYMQVSVNYDKGRPPRVVIITSKGRLDLGAGEVEMLDYAEIKSADVIINPYEWDVNGNKGIKAYLKEAFVTLNESELELKYSDVQDANPTRSSSTVSEDIDA